MATPTFPSYARIIADGYGDQADFGVIRSDMDGLAKQRPRWSKPIITRTVTIMLNTVSDRILFDTFVRDDLNGGSSWFTFTDPIDGVSKQGRISSGPVQWSTPGVVWLAKASIESLT
jgi:hypothetical protein